MHTAGYLSSVLIGVSLGLIGGGGSILTVPVLVYLFHIDAVLATAYSLFIVGLTSAVGSVGYFRKNMVDIKMAIAFGIPSIISVFLTRAFVIPWIPEIIFTVGEFTVTKNVMLLLLFAALMIAASYSMIRKAPLREGHCHVGKKGCIPVIILEGLVVGGLTGLIGAGGGFLIIPALVLFSRMPMKKAVGTSLVIIAAKSLIGMLGEIAHTDINWQFLLSVSGFAILGILIGSALSKKIDGDKLKPAFGWFSLATGIYIIIRETILR